jgi:hypothetical protein
MAAKKTRKRKQARTPWERPAPRKTRHTKLSSSDKSEAKQRAKKAGRPYPNLVDNMAVAKEKKGGRKKAAKKGGRKKAAKKKGSGRRKASKRAGSRGGSSSSHPRQAGRLKDPRGGLTAAGRKLFERKQGSHLKPGVTKSNRQMTPEDMRRKGSWATRFYGRKKLPPLVDAKGNPTRFALSAHAWGEPVPKTIAAARRIAAKGQALLDKYHRQQAS